MIHAGAAVATTEEEHRHCNAVGVVVLAGSVVHLARMVAAVLIERVRRGRIASEQEVDAKAR